MKKNISDLEREKKKLSIPLWFIAQRLFPERCHLSAFPPYSLESFQLFIPPNMISVVRLKSGVDIWFCFGPVEMFQSSRDEEN
jgi:hypothetical protein